LDLLLDSLHATWQPSDAFPQRLAKRLARAMWRLERIDGMRESIAVGRGGR